MSLCAWFPLIGTLDNQGIDNVSFTTTGTSWTTDGKLGKCLKLGYSSDFTIPSLVKSKQISIAYWLRVNTATSTQWLDPIHYYTNPEGGTGAGWVTRQELYSNCTLTGFWFDNGSVVSIPITVGQWVHFAITVDYEAGIAKVYKDGVLQGTSTSVTKTTQITGNNFKIGENGLDLSENDVRIYNHILSPKEVEILARGLVLHYPLSLPMPNLAKGSNTDSTSTNSFGFSEATGGSTRTIEYDGGIPCAKITRNSTAHSSWSYLWYSNWDRAAIKPSTTYTLSFDIIGSGSGSIGFSGFMQGNATNNISASVEAVQNTFSAGKWSHLVFRTTTIADFTDKGTSQTIYMNCGYLHNTDVWIMMKNMKLEEGVNDTPWIPHTSDAGYSTMGFGSTTEYDTSGYNNHGTINGGVSYSSDTARYVTSTYTTNTGYIQGINRVPTSLPTDSLTVNIWVKPTTWGTPISCTEGGGWNFEETGSGLQFQFYVAGVGYKPAKCSVTGASLQDGKWHMLTGTYDRLSKQVKFYIDGTLKATTDSGSTNGVGYANNFLILGGEASGSGPASTAYVGNLSDTRIYATALTPTQIQELYNTAISISNNGTLLGYELVEQ